MKKLKLKKWKELNKETRCDIICLTQGYVGIFILSYAAYRGWLI